MKALVLCFLLACGASQRHDTIATTMHAVDTAEAGFLAFDARRELDIVSAATSHDDGEAKLVAYRKQRELVNEALVAAYRAIAAAATLDDDPSMASMVTAAALVAQEIKELSK